MKKRSVNISGHATSVTVEDAFWDQFKMIAARDGVSINALIARIDAERSAENLSSALRLFVLEDCLKRTRD